MHENFPTLAALQTAVRDRKHIPAATITPALATAIIASNENNRKVRKGYVTRYAREMTNETWNISLGGEVQFFPDGRLADGQHRLHALAESGRTMVFSLREIETLRGADEGVNRTVADFLTMEGEKDPALKAQAARAVYRAVNGIGTPSNADVLNYFHEHRPFFAECVGRATAWLEDVIPANRILSAAEVVTARALAIRRDQRPPEQIDQFLEQAIKGHPPDGSMADELYKYLSKARPRTPALTASRRIEATLIAYELFLQGKMGRLEVLTRKRSRRRRRRADGADADAA